jgi:hypothetical protein
MAVDNLEHVELAALGATLDANMQKERAACANATKERTPRGWFEDAVADIDRRISEFFKAIDNLQAESGPLTATEEKQCLAHTFWLHSIKYQMMKGLEACAKFESIEDTYEQQIN